MTDKDTYRKINGIHGDPGAVPETALVKRLGDAPYGPASGLVGALNELARSGLPVPEGVVLTQEAHERYLSTSSLQQAIQSSAAGGGEIHQQALALRRRYESGSMERRLNRVICEVLIGLRARTVSVLSENQAQSGLQTIPEVRDAVCDAWLSIEGLKRQLRAVHTGEGLPTWPVLIQREVSPEYIGWTSTGTGSDTRSVALHDVEPANRGDYRKRTIIELALEAGSALGVPVRLGWGLEEGRWYVLTVQPGTPGTKPARREE